MDDNIYSPVDNDVRMMKLGIRYYAPLYGRHQEALNLLERISSEHGIEFEVIDLTADGKDYASRERQAEVYEQDFKPRTMHLSKKVRGGLPENLRSGRGKKNFYVAGAICIIKDGEIEWYTAFTDPLYEMMKKYDENFRVGFLKMLLERGKALVGELVSSELQKPDSEGRILRRFIESGILKGDFQKEVRVGLERIKREASSKYIPEFGEFENKMDNLLLGVLKKIDAVCVTSSNSAWILEVKRDLNEEAVGQVLLYSLLYQEDHPEIQSIQPAIVSKRTNPWIEDVCKKHGISIFAEDREWQSK
jgi:hypothetical protein